MCRCLSTFAKTKQNKTNKQTNKQTNNKTNKMLLKNSAPPSVETQRKSRIHHKKKSEFMDSP